MVFPKQVNSLRKECLFWMWRLYFREAGNILFLFYLKCVVKKQCSTSCDDQDRTTSIPRRLTLIQLLAFRIIPAFSLIFYYKEMEEIECSPLS